MFPDSGGQESQTTFRYLGGGSSLEGSMERIRLLNAESTVITQGPPERRLLNKSKQEIGEHGNIRRWTFGVKNPQKMMKTIILLGGTGTGKSTLINVMTNYILGVEWSDSIHYEMVEEEEKDQAESQISKVTVYEIFGYEDGRVPFSLRIIDTPGYGDTHGERRAQHIQQSLCHLFQCEDGVDQLDAVCLVVKASQNRLTPHQRCIFDAVLSLFGKNMKNNIIPIITFSGEGKPAALEALDKFGFSWSRDEKNNIVHFQFNNTPEDQGDEDTSPDYFSKAWEKRKSMEAFFEYLNNLEKRSLDMTRKLVFEQDKLKCLSKSLQDQIAQAEHLQNEIRQTQEALEKNKEGAEENKNFECVVEESFADKVESDSYATLCEKCKFTCHYLWSSFYDIQLKFLNKCTSCPGKCSFIFHVTQKVRYVTSVRKVTKTYEDLKEKYEESSRGVESEKIQKKLQEELSKIQRKKQRLILESYNHIIKLNEIALRPESLSILPNLNFLMEKLCEINRKDKVQKLEDIYKRAMEAHNTEEGEQSRFMKFITSRFS